MHQANQPNIVSKGKKLLASLKPFMLVIYLALAMFCFIALSGTAGWMSGRGQYNVTATLEAEKYLFEQYALAKDDLVSGRYELARQRFEYIFVRSPEFLDVADQWLQVMAIINTTQIPALSPTEAIVVITPTRDPRPIEELFTQSKVLIAAQDWVQAIDTLAALRREDPAYQFVQVDGMLYLALRNRGADKILNQGNLEGGLYDFALAEKFGPLDYQASNYRDWARLYLIGNSFWYAYPDIAASYYGQVAAVAPNLRDASGLTAFYRYWASLVQYGDKLAGEHQWCLAAEQYRIALNALADNTISATATFADQQCLFLTPSATASATATPSPSATGTYLPPSTGTATATATATTTGGPSQSQTPSPTTAPSATTTGAPAATQTATVSNTPVPASATPTPTVTHTPLP